MPRRPKSKATAKKPRPVNREDGKLNRWNKLSDIPLDDEDQFHVNKDQILLNGEDLADDDEGDEDEVFALKGIPASSSSDEGEEERLDAPNEGPSNRKKKKLNGKKTSDVSTTTMADEDNPDESEEEETWGSKKSAYYSTNAAHFDSEDEEANQLEEQEAKRLQSKARDVLTDDDFGLDDHVEVVVQEQIPDLTEPVLQVIQPLPQDKQSLLRHLEKTSPETLALARDWDDIARSVVKAGEKLKKMESEKPDAMSLGMVHLHYQTLLTYATTLAFYLHLRSKPKYAAQPDTLKAHPILNRLLTLKHSLATLEELDFDMSDESQEEGSDEFDLYDDEDDEDLDLDSNFADSILSLEKRKKRLELNELEELLKDAESEIGGLDLPKLGSSNPRKNKKAAAVDSKGSEPPKKKRKTEAKPNGASKPVFDLVEPEFKPSSNHHKSTSTSNSVVTELDVFGEQTSLHAVDAADKKARKKSLRFHTAKIESAAGRRERGVKNALGGDEDIPYKERKKQKEIRQAQELAKKGRGEGGDDLSDTEPAAVNGVANGKRKRIEDDDDINDDNGGSGGEEDADGYYSLVQKKSKERKEQKKAEYEAARAAERDELMSVETSNGPRGLTTAILKNRGLTPHRSKSVRNPRVKKRMRFEKAKKKIASQKAVYKGGIGDSGRYDGEKTGISKVIKAVKL